MIWGDRLEGLYDEPGPGAPRKVSDEQVERVVIQTLQSTPCGQTHWSTRELAKTTGLSRMTISRIWQAFGVATPSSYHRTRCWIEEVRDIAGLYIQPPDQALVLCVDEKSQIQALGSDTAAAAHATRSVGVRHARLQTARDDILIRRPRSEN